MAKCFFEKPYKEVFTSLDTYKNTGLEIAVTVGVNTLAATLLGKNKTQAALLGASSSLLANTFHFTGHRFEEDSPARGIVLGIWFSGLITAAAHSYYKGTPYLSWSNLSLTAAPVIGFVARNTL